MALKPKRRATAIYCLNRLGICLRAILRFGVTLARVKSISQWVELASLRLCGGAANSRQWIWLRSRICMRIISMKWRFSLKPSAIKEIVLAPLDTTEIEAEEAACREVYGWSDCRSVYNPLYSDRSIARDIIWVRWLVRSGESQSCINRGERSRDACVFHFIRWMRHDMDEHPRIKRWMRPAVERWREFYASRGVDYDGNARSYLARSRAAPKAPAETLNMDFEGAAARIQTALLNQDLDTEALDAIQDGVY